MDEHVILGKPEIKIEHKSVEASLFGISFEQFLKDNELNFSFSADSALKNVQLILPVELGLSWKSYVIAPGVMYNGNRFIVSPQPYCHTS